MEGKTVILSVFIMSLVMTQIQVEAKSCCPSTLARNIYNACRLAGKSRSTCAALSGCKIISGKKCTTPPYIHERLENNGDGFSEFCNLGCVSSVCINALNTLQNSDASKIVNVCSALNTLQNSDSSEIVNEAVDQCAKACSTLCTKDSTTETA